MAKLQNYLDTSVNQPYLITFKNTSTKYFVNPDDIGKFLNKRQNLQILSIKQFSTSKDNFKSVRKSDLKSFLSWNTEAIEELKRRNFIK